MKKYVNQTHVGVKFLEVRCSLPEETYQMSFIRSYWKNQHPTPPPPQLSFAEERTITLIDNAGNGSSSDVNGK